MEKDGKLFWLLFVVLGSEIKRVKLQNIARDAFIQEFA
jgi:hypothetical protein